LISLKYQKVNIIIKDYDDIKNHPLALKCKLDNIFTNIGSYNNINITFEGKMILGDNIYLQDEIQINGKYLANLYDEMINNFLIICNFKSNLLNDEYIYVDYYFDNILQFNEFNTLYIAYYTDNLLTSYEFSIGGGLDIILYNKKGKKIQNNTYEILVNENEIFNDLLNIYKEQRLEYIENIFNNLDDNFRLLYMDKMEKIHTYYTIYEDNSIHEIKNIKKRK